MDIGAFIGILKESLFMVTVFVALLIFGMVRGVQAVTNLILALYLALLVALKFPYFNSFQNSGDDKGNAIVMIILFIIFTVIGTFLFGRLMPTGYHEPAFTDLWKKVALAVFATILIMAYSYHALPVTDIITPGSPIQSLFAPHDRFFWWLILPIIGLFFIA